MHPFNGLLFLLIQLEDEICGLIQSKQMSFLESCDVEGGFVGLYQEVDTSNMTTMVMVVYYFTLIIVGCLRMSTI